MKKESDVEVRDRKWDGRKEVKEVEQQTDIRLKH